MYTYIIIQYTNIIELIIYIYIYIYRNEITTTKYNNKITITILFTKCLKIILLLTYFIYNIYL